MGYAEISKSFECTNHSITLRFLITANGSKQYRYQCIKCGDTVGKMAIAYSELSGTQRESATEFDRTLQEQRHEERNKAIRLALDAEKTEEQVKWFEDYNGYLMSPEWKIKRRMVLERDNYKCQARMRGCTATATQAHHLTYKHWHNEPLFELISVCQSCHDKITQLDRKVSAI